MPQRVRVVTSLACRRPKETEFQKLWQLGIAPTSVEFALGIRGKKGQRGVGLAIKEEIVKKADKDGITIECINTRLPKASIPIKSTSFYVCGRLPADRDRDRGGEAKYMSALNSTVASVRRAGTRLRCDRC